MKQYTCDVAILGKGIAKGVAIWAGNSSQAEVKKAVAAQFAGQKVTAISNIKERK